MKTEMKSADPSGMLGECDATFCNMSQYVATFEEPSCTGYIRVTLAKLVIQCSGFVTACSTITDNNMLDKIGKDGTAPGSISKLTKVISPTCKNNLGGFGR